MTEITREILSGKGSGGGSDGLLQRPTYDDLPRPGNTNILYLAEDTQALYFWNKDIENYELTTASIPPDSVSNSALQTGAEYSVKGTVNEEIVDITPEDFKDAYGLSTVEVSDSLTSMQTKIIPTIKKDTSIFYRDVVITATDGSNSTTIYGKITHKISNAIGDFQQMAVFNKEANAPLLFMVNDVTTTSSGFIALTVNNLLATPITLTITIN